MQGYKAGLYYSTNEETYAAEVAGTNAWTEIAKCEDIQPPPIAVDDVETHHLKTPDQFKTFEGGWGDGGEVTASVQFDATQYAAAAAMLREPKGWKILFADGTTNGVTGDHGGGAGFDGYVKSVGIPFEAEGLVKFELTIKVSGKPATIAASA